MNFDIAYIVSHGFAARMVTQTNLLGQLVEHGKRVALIAPDQNDSNLKQYCEKHGVALFEFNENGILSNQRYIYKRKYFLEELKSNPALWEKHIYATKYNRSLNPFTHVWPRYYGLIYRLRKKFPSIKERFKKKEKKYLKSAGARRLIEQLNPTRLVATYPVSFNEAALLYYGNQNPNTETWIHLLSWDNITCKGHFPELAEKYIAWGPIMKAELEEYYRIKPKNIHICGVPHFDVHLQVKKNPDYRKYLKQLGLDPAVKYLFFAMSSPRFAPREIEIVEHLSYKVKHQNFHFPIQLVIRPHPQNIKGHMSDKSWLVRLKELDNITGVALDMPILSDSKLSWSLDKSDMTRLAQVITGSSMVLNSGSTICIDALLHDKPVILTSFDANHNLPYWRSARRLTDYKHLRKLISMGGIEIAKNFEDLYQIINRLLVNPDGNRLDREITIKNECEIGSVATEKVISTLIS